MKERIRYIDSKCEHGLVLSSRLSLSRSPRQNQTQIACDPVLIWIQALISVVMFNAVVESLTLQRLWSPNKTNLSRVITENVMIFNNSMENESFLTPLQRSIVFDGLKAGLGNGVLRLVCPHWLGGKDSPSFLHSFWAISEILWNRTRSGLKFYSNAINIRRYFAKILEHEAPANWHIRDDWSENGLVGEQLRANIEFIKAHPCSLLQAGSLSHFAYLPSSYTRIDDSCSNSSSRRFYYFYLSIVLSLILSGSCFYRVFIKVNLSDNAFRDYFLLVGMFLFGAYGVAMLLDSLFNILDCFQESPQEHSEFRSFSPHGNTVPLGSFLVHPRANQPVRGVSKHEC